MPNDDANKIRADGSLMRFQPMRRLDRLSDIEHQREYVRRTLKRPVRSHRLLRPKYGEDPQEQRAAKVSGSILERIVYKKLTELLGPEGRDWRYKYGVNGTRVFKGGFEMDFEVMTTRLRPIDLEVQGAFWHGPARKWHDVARALEVEGEGFEYAEILEWEVEAGDTYLEQRLREIIGI